MKKIYHSSVILLILFSSLTAQTPQAFKYQAIVRDNPGNLIANQDVSLRITILQGNISETVGYIDAHISQTNILDCQILKLGMEQ